MDNLSRPASLTLAFAGGLALCIAGALAALLAWANPASAQSQTPRLIISPTEVSVGEGKTATYTVHFDRNPAEFDGVACGEPVYVNMRGFNFETLDVAPSTPRFRTGDADCDGGNWSSPKTIQVSPVDDTEETPGRTLTISHAVWDNHGGTPLEDTKTPRVRVTIYDNDPTGPWVSIEPGNSPTEGGNATFTLTRGENDENGSPVQSPDLTQPLTVNVSLSETRAMLSGSRSRSVTFEANSSTALLEVETDDDNVDGNQSVITATIRAPSGHAISGRPWATVEAKDNDFALLDISVDPNRIEEGQGSTVTVSITDGVTFAANQTIELITSGSGTDPAEAEDYTVRPESLTLRSGQSQATATITAVDDGDTEQAERINVSVSHEGRTFGPATITIEASDSPMVSRVRMTAVTATDAKAIVETVNADGSMVYLQYRDQDIDSWSQPTPAMKTVDPGETSVEFTLTGLTDGTQYEVQASLDSRFMDGIVSTTFTAGQQSSRPPGGGGGGGRPPSPELDPEPEPVAEPVIEHFWESPAAGATVTGIQLLRGWAFTDVADDPIAIVELHIDGVLTADIPCCTARADVAAAHPTGPQAADSGWGLTWNWGVLSAGPHTVQVWYETTSGTRTESALRTVEVVRPGGFEFLDRFDLSEATAELAAGAVVLEEVQIRDALTQAEATIDARFRWDQAAQGLALAAATTTAEVSMGQPPGTEESAAPEVTTAIVAAYEGPQGSIPGAGVGLLRGWAFSAVGEEITSVTVTVDGQVLGVVPCCSARADVGARYPAYATAAESGWGLTMNYGELVAGAHEVGITVEDDAGATWQATYPLTVVRLGTATYVDQFDLSAATVAIVGEELVLRDVVVRDTATQASERVTLTWRWIPARQTLGLVGSASATD